MIRAPTLRACPGYLLSHLQRWLNFADPLWRERLQRIWYSDVENNMKLNVVGRRTIRKRKAPLLLNSVLLFQLACSSNENAHTTATTFVSPPPRQVLRSVPIGFTFTRERSEYKPCSPSSLKSVAEPQGADLTKPLIFLNLENGKTFRIDEVVVLKFFVCNAKLRSQGGEFRVRYIIDDEDPQWIDDAYPVGLAGWLPSKHTIRFELIGPDGWPYRNGNQNIVTREITVDAK